MKEENNREKIKKKGEENLQGILTSFYVSYFSCAKMY